MKSLSDTLKPIGLAAGILCILTAPAFAQGTIAKKVTFDKACVLIPGTKITLEDKKKLNEILERYDRSFYRIQTYTNGTLTKTKGTLSDAIIGEARVSELAKNAKATGLSDTALMIGVCDLRPPGKSWTTHPTTVASATTHPTTVPKRQKLQEMVTAVAPVLQKYSEK
jgi:hypothetical protein